MLLIFINVSFIFVKILPRGLLEIFNPHSLNLCKPKASIKHHHWKDDDANTSKSQNNQNIEHNLNNTKKSSQDFVDIMFVTRFNLKLCFLSCNNFAKSF